MTTKHDTRPSIAAIHADTVAALAARDARKLGADVGQCAEVYAAAYAEAVRGQA
jgi:hypothetical protein